MKRLITVAFFGIVLSACGGGGGGNDASTQLVIDPAIVNNPQNQNAGNNIPQTTQSGNRPPVLNDISMSVKTGFTRSSIALQCQDPEGGKCSYSISGNPKNGLATIIGNTITYTIDQSYQSDSIIVVATDSGGLSDSAIISVTADPKATATVPIVYVPDNSVYDSFTDHVWVINSDGFTSGVSQIDIFTGDVAWHDLPCSPIATISSAGFTSLIGCIPKKLAFDDTTNNLWIVYNAGEKFSKMDVVTGLKTDYPTAFYQASGVVFDKANGCIWVSAYTGNTKGDVVMKVDIKTGTRTDYQVDYWIGGIALDTATNSIWVTSATLSKVGKIDIATGIRTDYPILSNSYGIVFEDVTKSVWVANANAGMVSKIDVFTGTRTDYPSGLNPFGIIFDVATKSVWTANIGSNTVSRIDIFTGTRTDYQVGSWPSSIAFDNVTNSIWVSNGLSKTVTKMTVK